MTQFGLSHDGGRKNVQFIAGLLILAEGDKCSIATDLDLVPRSQRVNLRTACVVSLT